MFDTLENTSHVLVEVWDTKRYNEMLSSEIWDFNANPIVEYKIEQNYAHQFKLNDKWHDDNNMCEVISIGTRQEMIDLAKQFALRTKTNHQKVFKAFAG